jgi:tRNA dimethylallyltransferase
VVGRPPLLVIVGPTGVGKTAVAVRLGAALPMEAVNADSRQVYRGMDIGTGKPTAAEQAALRHHLLDVVDPDQRYHVARFRQEALRALQEIRARGKLPAVVGGTGLYVRGLLKGLDPAPPADPALRRELEALAEARGLPALHERLRALDPAAASRLHPHDGVRIVRALEIAGARPRAPEPGEPPPPGRWATVRTPFRLLMVGLTRPRPGLNRRLADRVRDMVGRGMMEEVRGLLAAGYHESQPGMNGIGYRQLCAVLRDRMRLDEAIRLTIRDTTRYAKRQMTWFARDPEVEWIDVEAAGGVEGAAEEIRKRIERGGLME